MKKFKPLTPGSRHRVIISTEKFEPFKPLITGLSNTGFRNNLGRITVRHRGGAHKKNLRLIDINRLCSNHSPFQVIRQEKDPNRTAFIALCKTINVANYTLNKDEKIGVRIKGQKYFYIIAPHNLKPGTIIKPDLVTIGSTLPLEKIQLGTLVHNVQLNNGQCKLARSAGTYCTIISHNNNKTLLKSPSNKLIELNSTNKATIGIVSNILNNRIVLGKAGASRWIGRRPIVRGEVMNPIDHPHGGKTRGGRPLKNIWGKLAKWVPTSTSQIRNST